MDELIRQFQSKHPDKQTIYILVWGDSAVGKTTFVQKIQKEGIGEISPSQIDCYIEDEVCLEKEKLPSKKEKENAIVITEGFYAIEWFLKHDLKPDIKVLIKVSNENISIARFCKRPFIRRLEDWEIRDICSCYAAFLFEVERLFKNPSWDLIITNDEEISVSSPVRENSYKSLIISHKFNELKTQDNSSSPINSLQGYERAAENLIKNGLLARHYVDYDKALLSAVNPQAGEFVVAYGGSGPDISNLLLSTNFTKAYFLDLIMVSVEKLIGHHLEWLPIDKEQPYFCNKYLKGFSEQAFFKENIEFLIIQELRAIGVKKGDIDIKLDEQGRVRLVFNLAGESKKREIIFTYHNALMIDRSLEQELNGKLDAYYQKSVYDLPEFYYMYLELVVKWLKPAGAMMLCSYDDFGKYYMPNSLLDKGFVNVETEEIKIALTEVMRHIEQDVSKSLFSYGWLVEIWLRGELSKVQSLHSELISSTKSHSSSPLKSFTEPKYFQLSKPYALYVSGKYIMVLDSKLGLVGISRKDKNNIERISFGQLSYVDNYTPVDMAGLAKSSLYIPSINNVVLITDIIREGWSRINFFAEDRGFFMDVNIYDSDIIALTTNNKDSRIYLLDVFNPSNCKIRIYDDRGNEVSNPIILHTFAVDIFACGGIIYVLDVKYKNVLSFDSNSGEFLSYRQLNEGYLENPVSIVVDSNTGNIFISDRSKRSIVVFSKEGKYLGEIGKFILFEPSRLEIKDNNLYVIDSILKAVFIFRSEDYRIEDYKRMLSTSFSSPVERGIRNSSEDYNLRAQNGNRLGFDGFMMPVRKPIK